MTCNVGVRAIIKRNNKLLLVQRSKNSPKSGYWELPGGKTDCQKPIKAIRREIKEETGLKASNLREKKTLKDGKYIVKYFNAKVSGKVKIQESEVQEYGWFTKKEAKKLNLVSHTRRII